MKVKIEIDTQTFVRFWLVVIGFILALFALYSARGALIIIGAAFFLALALNSPVTWLARHLPGKSRIGGTAIAYFTVVMLIGAIIFLIVPPIGEQTGKFIDSAPQRMEDIARQWKGLGVLIERYHLSEQVDQAIVSAKANMDGIAVDFGRNILSGVGSIISFSTSLLLMLVLSFLMLIEGPAWQRRIWGVYHDRERMEHHRKLATRMYTVVNGYITGQLTVSSIGALCAGAAVFLISLFFSDVPANLAFPTIAVAFTLSLIPMFGATIAGVLVTLLLAFNNFSAALIFAVYFLIYQQIENNLISPTIQSRKLELSPLAVLTAVTIGLYVFGIAGGIISIPIAGCIKVMIEDYFTHTAKERKKSEKPIARLAKKLSGESNV